MMKDLMQLDKLIPPQKTSIGQSAGEDKISAKNNKQLTMNTLTKNDEVLFFTKKQYKKIKSDCVVLHIHSDQKLHN